MLIQAYDYWHLFHTEGCELQMGGSDQWGNITAGTWLVDKRERRQVHGLVFPLITTATGAKFGKSEAGNIWLDPERTSPYHFYQFWLNTDDRDVERYLKLFTFLALERIAATMSEHAARPEPARGATSAGARSDRHRPRRCRRGGRRPDERGAVQSVGRGWAALPPEVIADMPERRVSRAALPDGLPVVEVLVASGLASSKADARRGIQGKGFYLNGRPIDDVELMIAEDSFQGPPEARYVILRKGKKNYVRVVLEP